MVSYAFDPRPAPSSSAAAASSATSSSAASLSDGDLAPPLTFAAYPPSTATWPAPPGFATIPTTAPPERAVDTTNSAALPGSGFAAFTRLPTFSKSLQIPLAAYPPSTTSLPLPASFTCMQPHRSDKVRDDVVTDGISSKNAGSTRDRSPQHVDWPHNLGIREPQGVQPTASGETTTPPICPIPGITQVTAPKRGANTPPSQSLQQTSPESPPRNSTPTSPSTRVPLQDDEAVFASQKAAVFRYAFTVEDDKLSIWLENKKTKQQWKSDLLALDKFVAPESLIPMATIEDYVQTHASTVLQFSQQCFEDCLARSRADSEQTSCDLRQLTLQQDDELQLELQIRVQLFACVLTPTYRFTLYEVELDRVDMLTARVRSQDDELANLRPEINALKAGKSGFSSNAQQSDLIYFEAETTAIARSKTLLAWSVVNTTPWTMTQAFDLQHPESIRVLTDGIFMVMLVINYTSTPFSRLEHETATVTFQLLRNGHTVAASTDKNWNGSFAGRTVLSSSLQRVLTLQKNDVLSVMYTGFWEAVAGSSIIVYRLR